MPEPEPAQVLIVAHRTAATPRLLETVRARAARGPCRFTLLVPRPYWDPDTDEAQQTIELAVPLLDDASGSPVEAVVGDTDPFVAVQHELRRHRYDEIIVSTLPERISHWLHHDLPFRLRQFHLPITHVTATQAVRPLSPS